MIVCALSAGSVCAQSSYPARVDPYVNDFASLLTTEHTASLRSLFSELKSDNGVEIVVVTIDSIHDHATGDGSIESFATNLFNTWGVGEAYKDNGVLILVAWKDRAVRIEVGAGYGDSLNADMQVIIDEQMIPSFRNENYSQGIYDGARAVSRRLITRSDQATPPVAPVRVETTKETSASASSTAGSTLLIIVGIVGGAGATALGAGQYIRYHKRRCPNCRTQMLRLDEISDDVLLDSGQKVEELLQSVNYDVWKCPMCNFHTVQGYNRWRSSFGQCPQCNYRTLVTESRTIAEPTYVSPGTKLISQDCRHCKYHSEDKVILPMLTPEETDADDADSDRHDSGGFTWESSHSSSRRSVSRSHSWSSGRSSSSSRSSSGGRSRGGGASGKW